MIKHSNFLFETNKNYGNYRNNLCQLIVYIWFTFMSVKYIVKSISTFNDYLKQLEIYLILVEIMHLKQPMGFISAGNLISDLIISLFFLKISD